MPILNHVCMCQNSVLLDIAGSELAPIQHDYNNILLKFNYVILVECQLFDAVTTYIDPHRHHTTGCIIGKRSRPRDGLDLAMRADFPRSRWRRNGRSVAAIL